MQDTPVPHCNSELFEDRPLETFEVSSWVPDSELFSVYVTLNECSEELKTGDLADSLRHPL